MRFNPSALSNPATLSPGATGSDVIRLRQLLQGALMSITNTSTKNVIAAGLGNGQSKVYDVNLKQSVVLFQQYKHLTADGVVGPKTWAALEGSVSAAFLSSLAPSSTPTPSYEVAATSGEKTTEVVVEKKALPSWALPVGGIVVVGGILAGVAAYSSRKR